MANKELSIYATNVMLCITSQSNRTLRIFSTNPQLPIIKYASCAIRVSKSVKLELHGDVNSASFTTVPNAKGTKLTFVPKAIHSE